MRVSPPGRGGARVAPPGREGHPQVLGGALWDTRGAPRDGGRPCVPGREGVFNPFG